jgi:hypothetical protein
MGFKEWLAGADERASKASARLDEIRTRQATTGKFAGVYLTDGMIGWTDQGHARREPVTGARAEVAVGADAQRRITATRPRINRKASTASNGPKRSTTHPSGLTSSSPAAVARVGLDEPGDSLTAAPALVRNRPAAENTALNDEGPPSSSRKGTRGGLLLYQQAS